MWDAVVCRTGRTAFGGSLATPTFALATILSCTLIRFVWKAEGLSVVILSFSSGTSSVASSGGGGFSSSIDGCAS
jgi:hypothetical protein